MSEKKLRVGLLVDDAPLPAWAYRAIEVVLEGEYAEFVVVAVLGDPVSPASASAPAHRACAAPSRGAYAILKVIERRLVGKPGVLPDAGKLCDASPLLSGIERVRVATTATGKRNEVQGAALDRLREARLDVLLHLAPGLPPAGIQEGARYGVWYLQHGCVPVGDKLPATYWEVMRSLPVTMSVLIALTPARPDGRILARSYASTNDRSLADNASDVQWKSLHFIPRKLAELHREGGQRFLDRLAAAENVPVFDDGPACGMPTPWELSVLVVRKLVQKAKRKWEDIFYFRQWIVLFDLAPEMSTTLRRFRRIVPPKDRIWADPFVVSRNGRYFVFIEEMLRAEGRGHISVMVINPDGTVEHPVTVLGEYHHLSYPFVFEHEGHLYMIPESSENMSISLYRCVEFPLKWEFQKHLMEQCRAVDATVHHWNGKWWLFVNQAESAGVSMWDELFLYYSDSPLSTNWTPHRRNPVVSDTRSARSAGRLFSRDGRLYRPSQNCSRHYGFGFNIAEVITLTEDEYVERIVVAVEPNWDPEVRSVHTFNCESGLTVIDAQLRRRR
jgi:hypothetical protein